MKHLLLAITSLLTVSISYAGKASGGGDIIDINLGDEQKVELYDLVSKYTCDWKTGEQVINENPEYVRLLKKVSLLDWYFARDFLEETKSLMFCFTDSLLPVFQYYRTNPDHRETRKGAFRLGNNVYWDKSNGLSSTSKSLLIVHEVMHSYIDMDWLFELRYVRLTSMVKSFQRVATGEIDTRRKLHIQMIGNEILFPLEVDLLDRSRDQLEFLLAPVKIRAELILGADRPEDLADFNMDLIDSLSVWDRNYLTRHGVWNIFSQSLREALVISSTSSFSDLLSKDFSIHQPVLLALNLEGEFPPAKLQILHNSSNLRNLFNQSFHNLKTSPIIASDGIAKRAIISPEFLNYIHSSNKVRMTLSSLNPEHMVLNYELLALAKQISNWINRGLWEPVNELVLNNNNFYDSFGLKSQIKSLEEIPSLIRREKLLSMSNLLRARDKLIDIFIENIVSQIQEQENINTWKAGIDYERFEPKNL
ncbi:MAG: hypothetical protein AB8E15_02575 [Bdellovibrionales bacterium]